MKTSELRTQDDAQLKRLIAKMQMDSYESYGMMAQRKKNNPQQNKPIPRVDPNNRFRRRVIAKCLTILKERGVSI